MKKNAIIIDLDGTLIDTPHVSPDQYALIDWEEYNEKNITAKEFVWCAKLVNLYHKAGYEIVFLTARDDSARTRAATLAWLNKAFWFPIQHLFMRTPKDFARDHIVKEELLISKILPAFLIEFAIDDKKSNCDMFRKHGIIALQCKDLE